MTAIKIILIAFLVLVLRALLVQKSLVLTKRVVAFVLFALLVLLVLFPSASTRIANTLGVGRGVDLIFYFSHLFLLLLIVALWRRSITLTAAITELSRALALQNAHRPDHSGRQNSEYNESGRSRSHDDSKLSGADMTGTEHPAPGL